MITGQGWPRIKTIDKDFAREVRTSKTERISDLER